MRKEVSTPMAVALVAVVLVVVAIFGYRAFIASPHQNVSPEQQKENMRHMLPH